VSAMAVARPTRHAARTLPVLVEAVVALVYLLCTVVLEHDATLEWVATVVSRTITIAGTAAACILPVVTR
jgi:hypothetical protein